MGKVLAYDFHHRFALDTQLLREQVMAGILGEIYVTNVRALRRCGVPGWGVFTNKELQGGGPLIDPVFICLMPPCMCWGSRR